MKLLKENNNIIKIQLNMNLLIMVLKLTIKMMKKIHHLENYTHNKIKFKIKNNDLFKKIIKMNNRI
jgi:hypothetical protein